MNVVETAVVSEYSKRQKPSSGPRQAFMKGAAHWAPQPDKPRPKRKKN